MTGANHEKYVLNKKHILCALLRDVFFKVMRPKMLSPPLWERITAQLDNHRYTINTMYT